MKTLNSLKYFDDGHTDIGDILSISPKTVEFHIINVMNKLGASNKISAIVIAIQRGILEI